MKGKLTFLGTGGSVGVPVIGCKCAICTSQDSFNQRLRPSVLLQFGQKKFLVDVGPDFRRQALDHEIISLDGLILTHAHYDHTAGIDDLRPLFYQRETALPVLLSSDTMKEMKTRYFYLFTSPTGTRKSSYFDLQVLPENKEGEVDFEMLPIQYVTYSQGGMMVNGYRIGDMAYLTDIHEFSPSILESLKGVRYLIISALRHDACLLHLSVPEALDFAEHLGVEKAWFTHLSHELDYQDTNAILPSHVRLAYDGLEINFNY